MVEKSIIESIAECNDKIEVLDGYIRKYSKGAENTSKWTKCIKEKAKLESQVKKYREMIKET